jgi:hypothetical protein
MKIKSLSCTLFIVFALTGCIAPRLGLESVRYDNVVRAPTPEGQFIPIYDSRQDVSFDFIVIGEVIAAPLRAERDFGHDPIELLKKQAREIGGVGLVEVKSGSERDSRHVWKGKVIVKKQ